MSAPSIDIAFSRELLRHTLEEVREYFPTIKVGDAWVYKTSLNQWEFHYRGYYWHGRASNAYEARAKGWTAYVAKAADEAHQKGNAQMIAAFKKELGK